MASRGGPSQHLDARSGREVVYCHACSNEWYRDEGGLQCPRCEGDITEIIDTDNDPRQVEAPRQPAPPMSHDHSSNRYHDDMSDPEEEDIEEHLGPQGYTFRQDTRNRPDDEHHNPMGMHPMMRQFAEMVSGFSSQQQQPPRQNPNFPYQGPGYPPPPQQPRPYQQQFGNGPAQIRQTTFRSGFGRNGTASVTIVSSGPMPGGGNQGAPGGPDPFSALFGGLLNDIGPPNDMHRDGGGPPPNFARGLQELFGMLGAQPIGDAVYSQEALDRIITNLMEANPQSNAAPPATEQALQNLEKKPVDKQMLGGEANVECSICIDDMKEGDMAAFLPCKHWFHEECVTLWLKEHNTCPICRTPIEKPGQGQGNGSAGNGGTSATRGAPGPSSLSSGASHTPSPYPAPPNAPNQAAGSPPMFGPGSRGWFSSSTRFTRPSNSSHSSFHQAPSNSVPTSPQDGTPLRVQAQEAYDTSRLQRRSSLSPTSPRQTFSPAEQGARMRERSPSQSRQAMGEREQPQRQSSQGPMSWLRDRFTGGPSSSGPPRDERRH